MRFYSRLAVVFSKKNIYLPLIALNMITLEAQSAVPFFPRRNQKPKLSLSVNQNPNPKVIYGNDDRLDYFESKDGPLSHFSALSESTAALIPWSQMRFADNRFVLKKSAYGPANNLCRNEKFYNQPSNAVCSGFLISPQVLATASHCIEDLKDCKSYAFVFNYRVNSQNNPVTQFSQSQIFSCKSILKKVDTKEGTDFALIELDRPTDKPGLALDQDNLLQVADSVIVIGYPSGLPVKISGGASVRSITGSSYFTANLDSFGGSSGSAVFNFNTQKVVGILVRGETDFKWNKHKYCYQSKKCDDHSCIGEDVTSIQNLIEEMPRTRHINIGAIDSLWIGTNP